MIALTRALFEPAAESFMNKTTPLLLTWCILSALTVAAEKGVS